MSVAVRLSLSGLIALLGGLLLLAPRPGPVRAAEVPVVAAAADLQFALAEVAEAFSRATSLRVRLALGSSGNFTRQIIQGAPFEVFFSADEGYVRELAERSLTADNGRIYAIGRLVLYAPTGSPVQADPDMDDLAAAVADGRLRKLAIANPDHAPYGRAARAALTRKGLWEKLQGRLVFGENISQAAQFALSGTVEAGVIAQSLAISDRMARAGTFAVLHPSLYPPLRQKMVLLRGAGQTARRFYEYVQSEPARAAFERYGFALPTKAD
ncbi:MAG: molybdate ABC transporter substrate-binding protein [Betaproteobacteria bacterium RIFCSPLOWO2_12_FULL_63_13]|nr:MAG: molybdate ABC transporter substrate-binding protein [Betaproteobacteria bacterium RIFCSPLOWO2_12_FULL_63_13]